MPTHQVATGFSNKTFLVIDDFEDMCILLRRILVSCGANAKHIDTSGNGEEALKLLRIRKYDVVLCDYNLGHGKNGQHILEEARHHQLIGPACAWLMITAEKTNDVFMGTAECRPDDYLIKPITEAGLSMRLSKVWARKEAFRGIAAALARHDYAGAISLCDQRLTFDQANAVDLLRLRAKLCLESGDIGEARRTYEGVISERNLPWAKVGLADILVQEGGLSEAATLLEEVIRESKFYIDAYDSLARVYQMLGKHDEAEQVLERATVMSPNSICRQKMLGEVSLKLGKLGKAEKAFRKSVGLGAHSVLKAPDAHIGLARTCSAMGDPDEALRILDSVHKEFDDEAVRIKSLVVQGRIHQQNGDSSKALGIAQELSAHIKKSPKRLESEANIEMAQLFMEIGEKEVAATLLQEEVRNNPENGELLEQAKQVFADAQMEERGVALMESAREAAIEQMNRGVLLAYEGRLEEAVIWMRNACEAMPSNVRVLFNSAHVLIAYLKQAGPDAALISEAREILLKANRLAPGERRFIQLMEALNQF